MFPKMSEEKVAELINRRRHQIMVHSCIYYRFDLNIIDDSFFDRWCNELIYLQKEYPETAKKIKWHREFSNMTHASGFNLPYTSPEVVAKARYLLSLKGYEV